MENLGKKYEGWELINNKNALLVCTQFPHQFTVIEPFLGNYYQMSYLNNKRKEQSLPGG